MHISFRTPQMMSMVLCGIHDYYDMLSNTSFALSISNGRKGLVHNDPPGPIPFRGPYYFGPAAHHQLSCEGMAVMQHRIYTCANGTKSIGNISFHSFTLCM